MNLKDLMLERKADFATQNVAKEEKRILAAKELAEKIEHLASNEVHTSYPVGDEIWLNISLYGREGFDDLWMVESTTQIGKNVIDIFAEKGLVLDLSKPYSLTIKL
ncbi:MAG: hypothetical protein ACRC5M_05020 [Anaeroplasmataceae bacterium]